MPDFSTSTDLSRLMYEEMIVDDNLDYYTTAMIWLRILGLKNKNQDVMTDAERRVAELVGDTAFNLPEPLRLYLLTYGNITTAIGTHLYPEFPPLPEALAPWPQFPNIDVPGFYAPGPVDLETHNLYEEVPPLGMALAALVQAQANNVGAWIPPCQPIGFNLTNNLLNYRPTAIYRPEALRHIINAGITNADIEANPPNTGLNIQLLQYISDQLASNKTFKTTSCIVYTMLEFGSQAQIAEVHPSPGQPRMRTVLGDVEVRTLAAETSTTIGVAIAFAPRQFKDAPVDSDYNWSCYLSAAVPRQAPEDGRTNENNDDLFSQSTTPPNGPQCPNPPKDSDEMSSRHSC
ncbi:hypothetical protein J6590_093796 [Homalodisca vitripennis]|nr:hypothetical protein J6590_091040 [Homalodisca vitripennis]KAG8329115.1 hypothetical protein J6590_094496 [Homalodisca vitripennis]KAG8329136.1 hypothetical protein J6590_093796 [Homalodisca vitripennis]